jgi:hypothetical protein
MFINFPAEIFAEGLCHGVGIAAPAHGYVVLETIAAKKVQEFLKLRHIAYSDAAVTFERVIGEFALADVGLDCAEGIVRAYPGECHIAGSDSALYAGCLQQFFAEADSMKSLRPGADSPDSGAAQTVDYPAHRGKPVKVFRKDVVSNVARMISRICKRYAVLVQVVA